MIIPTNSVYIKSILRTQHIRIIKSYNSENIEPIKSIWTTTFAQAMVKCHPKFISSNEKAYG